MKKAFEFIKKAFALVAMVGIFISTCLAWYILLGPAPEPTKDERRARRRAIEAHKERLFSADTFNLREWRFVVGKQTICTGLYVDGPENIITCMSDDDEKIIFEKLQK